MYSRPHPTKARLTSHVDSSHKFHFLNTSHVQRLQLVCKILVVEQPDVLLDECDAQLLARLKHCAIVLTSCWRSDILGTTSVRPENVVNEREEGIRADGDALHLGEPLLSFLGTKWLRHLAFFEMGLEVIALNAGFRNKARAEQIDGIGF